MSEDGVDARPKGSAADPRPAPRRGGRGLALFAILVALAAAGLAGYPYYQQRFGAAASDTTLADLRHAQDRDAAQLRALSDAVTGLDDRLQQQQIRQAARFAEQDGRIEASTHSLADVAVTAASSARLQNSLRLTEAEYLLQGADHRLRLEGDARGALTMLVAAQQVLEQVDKPAVLGVRAKLADEIAALRSDPGVDVNTTFARLETLKHSLPEFPPQHAGFGATEVAAANDHVAVSMWQQALRKLLSLFEFHRQAGDGHAPLTVAEVGYLRLNLELLLQTAQLALLRSEAVVYGESLTTARKALDDYRGNNGEAVATAQAEIDQLLAISLHRVLPDLAGSLTELRRVLAPAAPAVDAEPSAP